jgi:hypothetical protein
MKRAMARAASDGNGNKEGIVRAIRVMVMATKRARARARVARGMGTVIGVAGNK